MNFSIKLKKDHIDGKHKYLYFDLGDSGYLDLSIDDRFCYSTAIRNKYRDKAYNRVIAIYNCNNLKEAICGNSDMPYQVDIDEIIKVLKNFIYFKENDERQQKEILFNNFFKFLLLERKGSEFIFDIELYTDSEGVEYKNITLKLIDIENICEFLKEAIIELLIREESKECYDDWNCVRDPEEHKKILKKIEEEHKKAKKQYDETKERLTKELGHVPTEEEIIKVLKM